MNTKSVKLPIPVLAFYGLVLLASLYFSYSAWKQTKGKTPTLGDSTQAPTATNTFAAVKSDKPKLQFFVMSFCPYGNQIEDVLKPVVDLFGDKADIQPQYIFDKVTDLSTSCKSRTGDPTQCAVYVQNKYFTTEAECKKTIAQNLAACLDEKSYIKANNVFFSSLHGRVEANQDAREICAWNQAGDKKAWWNFILAINKNCTSQNADTCWEEQAKSAGLDTGKITECFNKDAIGLIEKEVAETTKYNVSGSPTVLINGAAFPPESAYTQDGKATLKVGDETITQAQFRSPNALKTAICASFNKAPKECDTVLPEIEGAAAAPAGGCN